MSLACLQFIGFCCENLETSLSKITANIKVRTPKAIAKNPKNKWNALPNNWPVKDPTNENIAINKAKPKAIIANVKKKSTTLI
jgi:hypothetical protein